MSAPDLVSVRVSDLEVLRGMHRPGSWLTEVELAHWSTLRVPKRRQEWLAGRVAAKELVRRREYGRPDLRSIEISAAGSGPDRGRPRYAVGGRPGTYALSITHSGGVALAALARSENDAVGVDLEQVCARDEGFEAIALSPDERRTLSPLRGDARWRAVTSIWTLKEALLKALGLGLRVPMARLTVLDRSLITTHTTVATTASRLFEAAPSIRGMHPHLRELDSRWMTATTFATGKAAGAWLVLDAGEGSCSRS